MSKNEAEQTRKQRLDNINVSFLADDVAYLVHGTSWKNLKTEQQNRLLFGTVDLAMKIDAYAERQSLLARRDSLNKTKIAIESEIKATRENLKYHREKTKNQRLANEWHSTLLGEQWCLRAVEKELAQLNTLEKGKSNE